MSRLENILKIIDNPLLKRAFLFLEEGDWSKANAYLEEVLNDNPEDGIAYLGKLMIDTQAHTCVELMDLANTFDDNLNYQRCVRYTEAEIAEELKRYNDYILERNKIVVEANAYNDAVNCKNNAKTEAQFEETARRFQNLSGYRDSDKLAEECLAMAKEAAVLSLLNNADNVYAKARTEEQFLDAAKLYEQLSDSCAVEEKIKDCYSKAEECRVRDENRRKKLEAKKRKIVKLFPLFLVMFAFCLVIQFVFRIGIFKITIDNVKVGGLVEFGAYKGEPVIWRVLDDDVYMRQKLLLSENGIDYYLFDNTVGTWETSELRNWLQNQVYVEMFKSEENARIIAIEKDNRGFGNNTWDCISIMSVKEVDYWLPSSESRLCKPTKYAIRQGAVVNEINGGGKWWLRSEWRHGEGFMNARACVDATGRIVHYENEQKQMLIRPVIVVKY